MHSALEQRGNEGGSAESDGHGELGWRDLNTRPESWDDEARLRGNPFHCSAYLHAHCERGEQPVGLTEKRSSQAVIAGIRSDKMGAFQFRAYSFMSPHIAPITGSELVEWLRSKGCRRFVLGSFSRGMEEQQKPRGVKAIERFEFVHHLGCSQEEWWERIHSNHRRKLRKAHKAGFVLRKIPDNHAAVMARLSISWSKRRGLQRSWADFVRSWWKYRRLLTPLSRDGIGALYGLYRKDGALLSAAYMLETHASAFYMLGASSEAGYRAGASFDLFWQLGHRYREGGLSSLNLGGVPTASVNQDHAEHGVYRFKSGFGIEPSMRVTWVFEEKKR